MTRQVRAWLKESSRDIYEKENEEDWNRACV